MKTTLPPPVTIYGGKNMDAVALAKVSTDQIRAMLHDSRIHEDDERTDVLVSVLQFRQPQWGDGR